ncbi:MAG TPA: hypothetical protein VMJ70_00525 [Candidatus Sulfotelmatobacter sp.]|nr:hypothetical protein [Candidatus Sulfotelmatobacter sp.]
MTHIERRPARGLTSRRAIGLAGLALALLGFASPPAALAGHPAPFAAKAGVELAQNAARSWAADAQLIYVENDDDLDDSGAAVRWGYLFYSASLDQARAYSVRNDKIVQAENLAMKFQAPPLAQNWMDSGAALQAADRQVGHAFRQKHQGHLSAMLLMRGAFQDADPDPTTWTLVYTAPHSASLFVMVDASAGKVRRTWRG